MNQNRASRGSGTPFHINGNNIMNHKPNSNNSSSNQYSRDIHDNNKSNDSALINQLRNENKQLKMELQQKNKTIEDCRLRINKLERTIQSLKRNQGQGHGQSTLSNNHASVANRPLYGNMMGQPFMLGPENFFNNFFGMDNNAFEGSNMENDFSDPVKEVEDHIIDQLYPNPDNMTYEELLALEEEVGSVSKGLSQTQINRLPLVSYSKYVYKAEDKCVICQYEFKNNERVRKLPCGHIFHKECVDEWLLKDKACPCCKKEVRV